MNWKLAVVALALSVIGCSDTHRLGPTDTESISQSDKSRRFSSPLDATCPFCLVAGDTLVRTSGAPTERTYMLSGNGFFEYVLEATLIGEPSANAQLSLDGKTLFSTSDFAKAKGATLKYTLPAAAVTRQLTASLRGGPGGRLALSVKPIPKPLAGIGLVVNHDPTDSAAFYMVDTTGAQLYAWRDLVSGRLTVLATVSANRSDTSLVSLDERGLPTLIATPDGHAVLSVDGWRIDGSDVVMRFSRGGTTAALIADSVRLSGPVAGALMPYIGSATSSALRIGLRSLFRSTTAVNDPPSLGAWLSAAALVQGVVGCATATDLSGCTRLGIGFAAGQVVGQHQTDGWVDAAALYTQVGASAASCLVNFPVGCFGLFATMVSKLEPKDLYIDPSAPVGLAGQPLSSPIRVVVLNGDERAMWHWPVRYAIVDGGGSLDVLGTTIVDKHTPASQDGATASWFLGPVIGEQHLEVSVPVYFVGRLVRRVTATARQPIAPWWNAVLDFNGGALPTGWNTRLLGGSNPGLHNDRLESQPVDNGPWVTSTGRAPAGLLGVVVQYDGQAAQSFWGNGQAIDLWIGTTRNALNQVNATYNFGAGNIQFLAGRVSDAPVYRSALSPFTAGDHRFRVVVRPDSVLWTSRLTSTSAPDAMASLASPGWDLTQIDSVGIRAQASDVPAWMDNVRIRAITSLGTTATLDLSPATASVTVGQTVSLGFEARNINGALLSGKMPTWSSLNPGVAAVNSAGIVTGLAAGTATITSMVDGAVSYATVTVMAGPVLLYSDDFAHGLGNWISLGGGSWTTPNNELIGDYNIGCGSPDCSQADLLLVDQLQPGDGNWRLEVRSNRVQAYCCYNGGAQANFAKFSVFVSPNEKDDFEVGMSWVPETTTPVTASDVYAGFQMFYPWHTPGYAHPTVATWQTDAWQTATLEKRGNQLTLFWNGVQVYSVTRTYSSAPKVGLHTYGMVRMDDFKLYALP